MTVTEKQKQYAKKYIETTYDEIKVRVPKGKKQEIKEYAESKNESLNGYINRIIEEDMNKGTN